MKEFWFRMQRSYENEYEPTPIIYCAICKKWIDFYFIIFLAFARGLGEVARASCAGVLSAHVATLRETAARNRPNIQYLII
jgi:hypothetical protein